MAQYDLEPGSYVISFSLSGYEYLTCEITLGIGGQITCDTTVGCPCGSVAPGLLVSGRNVTGYLKIISEKPTNITEWVASKGGSAGLLNNYQAVAEIIDAYLGIVDAGFTVTGADVATVIDYVLGLKS